MSRLLAPFLAWGRRGRGPARSAHPQLQPAISTPFSLTFRPGSYLSIIPPPSSLGEAEEIPVKPWYPVETEPRCVARTRDRGGEAGPCSSPSSSRRQCPS